MDVTFTFGQFLPAMLAVAIPIVVHLFMRHRPRTVDFPPARLLLSSIHKSERKSNFKYLLLLLMRMLIIALFVLALAKPLLKGVAFAAFGKAVVNAVVIVDNSYSMGYKSEDTTPFETAKTEALSTLDTFDTGSNVAVLATSYQTGQPEENLSYVASQLEGMERSSERTRCFSAVAKALAILETLEGVKELYLFTDLTRTSWQNVVDASKTFIPSQVKVYVIDTSDDKTDNAYIRQVKTSWEVVRTGFPIEINAEIVNDTTKNVFQTALVVDGREVARKTVTFEQSKVAAVSFQHVFNIAGVHQGSIKIIDDDPLMVDNERFFTIQVGDVVNVLIINGDPQPGTLNESFYVETALNPFGEEGPALVNFEVKSPSDTANEIFSNYEVVFLLNCASLPEEGWKNIAGFVLEGGGMFISLGDRTTPNSFKDNFAKQLTLFHYDAVVHPEEPVGLIVSNYTKPLMEKFKSGDYGDWTLPLVTDYVRIVPIEGGLRYDELMGYSTGDPALILNTYGKGRVLIFTSTMDADWGDLPKRIVFVPFVYEAINFLAKRSEFTLNYLMDDYLNMLFAVEDAKAQTTLMLPEGNNGGALSLSQFVSIRDKSPGNYKIITASGEKQKERGFSINLNSEESNMERIPKEELQEMLPNAYIANAADIAEVKRVASERRSGVDLTYMIILAALSIVSVETIFSNRFF